VQLVGRKCFSRKATPAHHGFKSLGLLEDFCAMFRKRYVDGALDDAVVPCAAHRKARMLPFHNPAPKPSSLPNNFWKSAVIIRNKRPYFGNQNASKVKGKKRKVEERSQKAIFLFEDRVSVVWIESQELTCLDEVSNCAQGGL
jgi:hypothetical protein